MMDNNRRLCHKDTLKKIGCRILWDKEKLENGPVKIN